MNSMRWLLLGVVLALGLTACGRNQTEVSPVSVESAERSSAVSTRAPELQPETATLQPVFEEETNQLPVSSQIEELRQDDDMIGIEITVGNKTFAAKLYKNETAQALSALFPMTISMDELHGNEKYNYLEESLPLNALRPAGIHTGDLMLYGSDCLVLFYDSFETSYSYTPLGFVEDVTGLSEALGTGSVQVTFELT